jgi:Tfp pilus assembly protein PilX
LTRSSHRAPSDRERGFALISALVLAALYLGLIALVLLESTVRYRSAQRYRSRVVAQTLAESAAELAGQRLLQGMSVTVDAETADGTMSARSTVSQDSSGIAFRIDAEGTSQGVQSATASVTVWGHVEDGRIRIIRTNHSQ